MKDAEYVAVLAQDMGAGHGLVIELANTSDAGFEGVTESGVSDVVKESSGARDGAFKGIAAGICTVKDSGCDVLCSDGVSETGVFCAVIDESGESELTDASKSLNDIGVNEGEQHVIDVIEHVEMNDVMDGITKEFFTFGCGHERCFGIFLDLTRCREISSI